MKTILLLSMCVCLQTANAQDYCKRIKKESLADTTMFEYTSPFNQQNLPAVRVQRSYTTDPDNPLDNFVMIFQVVAALDDVYNKSADGGQTEKDEKKLVIEFDDKSRLTDETIQVTHDVTEDKMQSVRYVYYPLDDKNVKEFTSKKIAKFSIADHEQAVPTDSATALTQYVQCLKALK